MNMFVPIKVMTDYSMLQSMITIPKLILFLKKYNIQTCGICDKNLFGLMEFYTSMQKENIKPLIGFEIVVDSIPLYLYARNYKGYQALLKINTLNQANELHLGTLEQFERDLNIILPYLFLNYYKDLKEKLTHLYIGYTTEYEKNNANVVTENIIFCPNIKAFSLKDSEYLNLLKAIDLGESLKVMPKENYEKNTFEYYLNERIEDDKTKEFIESCEVEFKKNVHYIPKFQENVDSNSYLIALAKKGLAKRCQNKVPEEYINRLKYELSVIQNMGFADYFLIVYDYVKYAKTHDVLVGVGRGSAVGSLVSYSLGITDVDPLKYHLLFERFLNPDRITMPDIDIDFEENGREKVVNYVKSRYGEDCVANIITFGTLKSKLVLRSVGKALEVNSVIIDSFVNKMDAKLTLKENLMNKDLAYYVTQNQEIKKMVQAALQIEGLKKHSSTHAAGVVISSVPLDEVIPTFYNGPDLLTGFTMNYLEDMGLLKMDFLVITNLTIMKNVLELIEQNTGQKLDLKNIDLNDPKVLETFAKADTVGIFQFESEGMKNFLRKLKPSKFLDIVSAIALFRPGPMENIDTYIRRKEGKEKITYLHEDLTDILSETYGIIVYQEQIMQILSRIGGFSFAEADTVRRAMSKKKKELIESFETKFITGALQKGYKEELAREVYALILKFANYGFNKSHSVAYAMIGYQMAYLKCYYPLYFIANLLNMNIDSVTKTKEYLALAKQSGITILPPDINLSSLTYVTKENTLRLPFGVIKNLGVEMSKAIVSNRGSIAYSDFFDFVKRNYKNAVHRNTIEALIKAGAFDSFGYNHNTLIYNIDSALNYAMLSSDLADDYVMKPAVEIRPQETEETSRQDELEIFGFYLSNHPASKYIDKTIMKLERIDKNYDNRVRLVVLIDRIKTILTKKGEKMAFVTASDETASGNFVFFAPLMKELEKVKVGDLVCIEGRVSRRFADYQVNVNKVTKIGE